MFFVFGRFGQERERERQTEREGLPSENLPSESLPSENAMTFDFYCIDSTPFTVVVEKGARKKGCSPLVRANSTIFAVILLRGTIVNRTYGK